ncbi:hypothetical protein CY34DRAFT_709633 [Suillus luteus UH-Slu-Lm8-n1]|uniref:Uncharacterized protein n=1 Tax=Suillus luteus UH-Slu-Lm8-n1 TaxID=930992 RepID=A0A0D0B0A1_9AGAM|nr:hypothetical protein CY34DRAFT_709633 [Suillus luteus UH-Slu-Lm8-n1]
MHQAGVLSYVGYTQANTLYEADSSKCPISNWEQCNTGPVTGHRVTAAVLTGYSPQQIRDSISIPRSHKPPRLHACACFDHIAHRRNSRDKNSRHKCMGNDVQVLESKVLKNDPIIRSKRSAAICHDF